MLPASLVFACLYFSISLIDLIDLVFKTGVMLLTKTRPCHASYHQISRPCRASHISSPDLNENYACLISSSFLSCLRQKNFHSRQSNLKEIFYNWTGRRLDQINLTASFIILIDSSLNICDIYSYCGIGTLFTIIIVVTPQFKLLKKNANQTFTDCFINLVQLISPRLIVSTELTGL